MAIETDVGSGYDVFISHAGLDDDLAKAVQKLLISNGVRAFCTPDSIPSGKWEKQIEEALEQSTQIWVLLTPNSLARSVWVHHELGYFYGFNKSVDPDGHRSRYLFEEGNPRPGLYAELQGTEIENIGDPVAVASIIAENLGKEFEVPPNWDNCVFSVAVDAGSAGADQFQTEISEMTASPAAVRIKETGHWELRIHPTTHQVDRVAYASLHSTVYQSQVSRLQPWDFPSVGSESDGTRGEYWHGEEYESEYPEVWRISQSGHFLSLASFPDDDLDELMQVGHKLTADELFSVNSAVFYVSRAFQFAASLARNNPEWGPLIVELSANGIQGRTLAGPRGLVTPGNRRTDALAFNQVIATSRDDLIQDPNKMARQVLAGLFQRFGWSPDAAQLEAIQSKLR